MAVAVEQCQTEFVLKLTHGLTHGRLGQKNRFSGLREPALPDNLREDP
jgi:hypothetical protein